MRCGFDITCHLVAWFWSLPWWVHWGLVGCIVLALWGIAIRLWNFAKGVGGWQAALAAVGALGLILVALWPKVGHKVATDELFPHPDAEPPLPIPRPVRKKKRSKTIFGN